MDAINKAVVLVGLVLVIMLFAFYNMMTEQTFENFAGHQYTKDDLFRVQVANDPFYDSIVFEMTNLTYEELVGYQFTDEHFNINKNTQFWRDVVKYRGDWNELVWEDSMNPRYIEQASVYARVEVWG